MIAVQLSEQFWWYVARSSGFVSWGALTLAVLWGLALSTRLMGKKAPPAWLLDAHRFLGALSVVFVAVHLVALVFDDYVYFGWAELFVPMASAWQPGAVAWGVVSFYLLVAIQITSLLMSRLPRRLWRWVHFSSFALWVLATVHVIEAGTDVTNRVFRYSALASVQLVLFFIGVRVLTARRLKRALRAASRESRPTSSVDDARAARLAALQARRADPTAEPVVQSLSPDDDRRRSRVVGVRAAPLAAPEARRAEPTAEPSAPQVMPSTSLDDPHAAAPVDPALAARLEVLRRRRDRTTVSR